MDVGCVIQVVEIRPNYTVVEVFIGSKVQCLFCFETSTTEGRGEVMGGSGNFKNRAHRTFDPRNYSTPVYNSLLKMSEYLGQTGRLPLTPILKACNFLWHSLAQIELIAV